MAKKIKLIAEVALQEAINEDINGLDKAILFEATKVKEEDMGVAVDGDELLMQLMKEGLM